MEESVPVARASFVDLNQVPLSLHLGNFTGEVLYWGLFEPHRWRNYLHRHSFFEICYAFAGQGTFRLAGKAHDVRTGHLFIARPGEVHEIISSNEDPLGIYFWSYTLVPGQDCEDLSATAIDTLLHAFITSCQPLCSPISFLHTLELLTEEIARKEPGYVQVIEGLVIKLLLDTARANVKIPAQRAYDLPFSKSSDEKVTQIIIRYLYDNYSHAISLRDVAAQVHLSERHTSRLFHKIMGVSILEYLTKLRLETAAQLLLNRHTSIKEVAQASGYPDVRYFITLFHRHTGLTPAVFRRHGGTSFLAPAASSIK